MATLKTSKSFKAGVEQLFNAWTKEDQLKSWWQPLNKQLKKVDNDLSEGGTVRYEFEDGIIVEGEYKTVESNKLLVYTWNWDFKQMAAHSTHYTLHVHFKSEGDTSTIDIEQEGFEDDQQIGVHKKGWDDGLQQLATFLEDDNTASRQADGKPPVTGYNETPEQQKVGGA